MRVVVMVFVIGCGDNLRVEVPADAALPEVAEPHLLIDCGSSWQLPVTGAQCEQACVPRPALASAGCAASHGEAVITCGKTFAIESDGQILRGCCGLYSPPTVPTPPSNILFLTCD
jgi:hypothetical protein